MKIANWISLIGLASLLWLIGFLRPQYIEFQDLDEAAAKAEAVGFYVASDRADGVIEHGFVVSPYPVNYADANLLLKIGKMGPAWKDKVWVTRTSSNFCLEAIPDDAAINTWGNVVGIGDPELLKRFQAKFCNSRLQSDHVKMK